MMTLSFSDSEAATAIQNQPSALKRWLTISIVILGGFGAMVLISKINKNKK